MQKKNNHLNKPQSLPAWRGDSLPHLRWDEFSSGSQGNFYVSNLKNSYIVIINCFVIVNDCFTNNVFMMGNMILIMLKIKHLQ